jgi:NTE family protein
MIGMLTIAPHLCGFVNLRLMYYTYKIGSERGTHVVQHSHHRQGDPAYNNPSANRFPKLNKRPDGYARVAFVLQGGGALGAYQLGVMKGLVEAGYVPDWICATSIGAIQAGIFVGNTPENRIAKLEEFWQKISTYTPFDILGYNQLSLDFFNHICSSIAVMVGQRDFFRPRWASPYLQVTGTPDKLSIYDTTPLRETLLDLIDFDLLNNSPIRLSLGAVQVSSGNLLYFNNINYLIRPEHIMASGALPPGFPAVKIDGEYYWDGGIHSNSPLEVIFNDLANANTLCFVIDCFGGSPFVPTNMEGVAERMKDIAYSTHAQLMIKHHIERFQLKSEFQKLTKEMSAQQIADLEKVLENVGGIEPSHMTVVHVTYSARVHRGPSKDYNFSHVITNKRIDIGYQDIKAALAESEKWNKVTSNLELRLYEAPNNLSRFTQPKNDWRTK